ncbi:succinyl-diaminopimelate desuccinylase [Rickettsia canadensis str. CA410]|nr:succinyl-diaminopimelate desuccinylase [Rickettsia canadensis str. CA410]
MTYNLTSIILVEHNYNMPFMLNKLEKAIPISNTNFIYFFLTTFYLSGIYILFFNLLLYSFLVQYFTVTPNNAGIKEPI